MDIETVRAIVDIGVPTALVITGLWFGITKAWPYWTERDTQERDRRNKAQERSQASEIAIASSLGVIADHLGGKIHVTLDKGP